MFFPNNGTIFGVPVDQRLCTVRKFEESLKSRSKGLRTPILCNAGFRGSGKTVLQGFNMYRFVEQTNGIAIEVTFNDDQGKLWPGHNRVTDDIVLEKALACRMLYRVMQYQTDAECADMNFEAGSPIIKSISRLRSSLKTALSLVRLSLKMQIQNSIIGAQ